MTLFYALRRVIPSGAVSVFAGWIFIQKVSQALFRLQADPTGSGGPVYSW
jgi:hypothetical protein